MERLSDLLEAVGIVGLLVILGTVDIRLALAALCVGAIALGYVLGGRR